MDVIYKHLFNTSKNRITSKSFKNMLLTPSLKTELYTHYAFLPRCVPVPCEFRGDDTRWIVSTVSIWSGTLSSSPPPGMNQISTGISTGRIFSARPRTSCLPSQCNVMEIHLSPSQVTREAQNSQRLSSQTFSTFFCRWMKRWDMYEMYIDMYFSLKSSLT